MPYARQAAAADFSFPVRQPHSHNLPLGVLGDAGIVGLAAGLDRRRRRGAVRGPMAQPDAARPHGVGGAHRPWRRRAVRGPHLPARIQPACHHPRCGRPPRGRRSDLGADQACRQVFGAPRCWRVRASSRRCWSARWSWRMPGRSRIAPGYGPRSRADWAGSAAWLARAVEIDRWHPAGPRALAVAADAAGQPDLALQRRRAGHPAQPRGRHRVDQPRPPLRGRWRPRSARATPPTARRPPLATWRRSC